MGRDTLNCLVYRFKYTDGAYKDMGFGSKSEAYWFAKNEGDHLVAFYRKRQ